MTVLALLLVAILGLGAALLPAALFWRCRKVDALRCQVLQDSYRLAADDMNAGLAWEWRFEACRTGATFNEMVWKIWRPVSSFYEPSRPLVRQ